MFFEPRYNTLDALACDHRTDKRTCEHGYTEYYYTYFHHLQSAKLKLLEIGVGDGASHRMWCEYFPHADIFGIDSTPGCKKHEQDRLKIYIGSQTDRAFLAKVAADIGKIDILIDDGGHTMQQQTVAFQALFPVVAAGGVYVIEDTHTSYQQPGCSTLYRDSPKTTIEYIKDLIDIVNFIAASNGGYGNTDRVPPVLAQLDEETRYLVEHIKAIHICSSIVFIFKK